VLIEDALKVWTEKLEPQQRAEVVDILHASHRGLISAEDSRRQVTEVLNMNEAQYAKVIHDGEVKNQPLMDYIVVLKKQYKTALLSNISIGGITSRFSVEELQAHFDTVVASGEVGYAKPEAEIYELAAERLEVRLDECVFTDDREEYCEGARAVGMQAILFEDLQQFKRDLQKLLPTKPSI
jgi:putative hydrolase of the HAD superfamily